jgi:hypothetical protein
MKLLVSVILVALCLSSAQGKQCSHFDRLWDYDPTAPLPPGYTETGIPNVILNEHNKVVRTDDEEGPRKSLCPHLPRYSRLTLLL